MDRDPNYPHQALTYSGRIGELYPIFLLNLLFTVLTLGIYRFWAITRYRQYFWSRMSFQGQPFEYTGTGGQLFVGFLLAMLILFGMIGAAFGVAYVLPQELAPIPIVLVYIAVFVLAAGAVFAAQRYRLSRTMWCGIRGGMSGSALAYGGWVILYGLLALVTFYQMVPYMQIRLAERRINASSFGTAPFHFQGRARSVYGPFLLTWLGEVVLLAIYAGLVAGMAYTILNQYGMVNLDDPEVILRVASRLVWVVVGGGIVFTLLASLVAAWYMCVVTRHIMVNTTIGSLRLGSAITPGGLVGLIAGNFAILLFTLGLGFPIVLHRNAKFLARTLLVQGRIDPALLGQTSLAASRYGEGMFQALDAGVL